MTFAASGAFLFSNNAALTVSNQGIGNLLVVEVLNYTNSTVWCTGLSGGGATWTQAGVKFSGTTNAYSAAVFLGKVTATGGGTVTPSWSGTAPSGYEINGHEFTSTAGSWAFDVQGNLDVAGTNSWPSLTPGSGSGELYFGFSAANPASAGSTSGYTYSVNANMDAVAFNPACGAGATFPVWADSTQSFGIAVLIAETAAAPPAAAPASRAAPWWKPGRNLPGLPLGVPFYTPPQDTPPLAAAIPAATPAPLIAQAATAPGYGIPGPAVTARGSLQDFATPVTPAPVIVPAPPPPQWGRPAAGLTSRNSLADAPVLTTPAPVITGAAAAPGWGAAGPAVIGAAPPAPAAAPAAATPAPLVAAPAAPPPPAAVTVVTRGAAQDPADFRGRQPVIAVPRPPGAPPAPAVISRSSLADAPVTATPAPLVIPAAATPGWGRAGPAVISAGPGGTAAASAQATPAPGPR